MKAVAKTNVIPLPQKKRKSQIATINWNDRDPKMVSLCKIIRESKIPPHVIAQKVAKEFGLSIAPVTIYKWLDGTTKQPRNELMDRVGFVLGYERGDWKPLR